MKDDLDRHDHNYSRNQRRYPSSSYFPGKFCNTRHVGYVLLLILSYALGYFSAKSSISSNRTISTTPTVLTTDPPPPPPLPPLTDDKLITTATTLATATKNNPSSTATTTNNTTATALAGAANHNLFGTKCADPIPHELIRQEILSRIFNSTSPFDNYPPPHITPYLQTKRIKGWGSYGSVFETLIRKTRPNTIIEIGTFLGASATHMARLTRELGLQTQILCLDDFRGWPGFRDKFKDIKLVNGDVLLLEQFLQNVIHMNVSDMILPLPFSTASSLIKLCEWGITADLIEIDAGHS